MERLTERLAGALPLQGGGAITLSPLGPSGESPALYRLSVPPGRGSAGPWIAKQVDRRLTRELEAYRGPLLRARVAPHLVASLDEDDGSLWLVLEDAGEPLDRELLREQLERVAALVARIHQIGWHWPRRLPWPRPVHVVHGRRHLRGEWRIALRRLRAAAAASAIPRDAVPDVGETRRVLALAWSAAPARSSGFVHGDLQVPNVVQSRDGELLAVDWSQWGRGSQLRDLTGIALDLSSGERDRFLRAYLERRGRSEDAPVWAWALERALPLRHLLGLGALASYAVDAARATTTADARAWRLAAWERARREVAAWS